MARRPEFSRQTLFVLALFSAEPPRWWHGNRIARHTGLKPGTLYPILIRLAGQGLMDACWEDGRSRRHLYRLTPDGLARAEAALAGASASASAWAPLASAADAAWAPPADDFAPAGPPR